MSSTDIELDLEAARTAVHGTPAQGGCSAGPAASSSAAPGQTLDASHSLGAAKTTAAVEGAPQAPAVVGQENPRWTKADSIRTAVAGVVLVVALLTAWYLHYNNDLGARASVSLLVGLAIGIVFERGRFCFYCIFRDHIEDKNSLGMYSVLVALAVGSIGYNVVFGMFLPDPLGGHLPPAAHIGPVSWVLAIAGVVFGLGMSLSGACISGHLYRLGQGYTRAIPALLGALVGFGIGFATWNWFFLNGVSRAQSLWLPNWLGYAGALLLQLGIFAVLAVVWLRKLPARPARPAGPLTLSYVRDAVIRNRWGVIVTGTIVGLLGTFYYLRVQPLGVTAQLGSLSRTVLHDQGVLPDRLNGLDTLKGCATAVVHFVTENGWLVIGLVVAAFAAALAGNRFKPSKLTVRGGSTALLGGVLMGWGSMIGLGCTVGVLLSGISAFAVSGWVFGATCFFGVWLGIKLRLHRLD